MLPMKIETHKENSSLNAWTAIVLAAGKGTRMATPLPKVLHPVGGVPMIQRVIESCRKSNVAEIRVVLGHGSNLVKNVIEPMGVQTFLQKEQLGTADAVLAAEPDLIQGSVLIVNGDHPLVTQEDIGEFIQEFEKNKWDLAVVTATLKDPKDFGRIVRHKDQICAIVEAKDASADTLKIKEVNTGLYLVRGPLLADLLSRVTNNNSKKEYYLTDILSLALERRSKVGTLSGHPRVSFGVNTQQELSRASRIVYRRKAKKLMDSGVLLLDPHTTYVEESVEIAPGSVLYPNVFIRGRTKIGPLSSIEPNCFIVDSQIGEGVQVRAQTYLERVTILNRASVGPFARLRPETIIGEEAHVGNFVEMKKVKFGARAKAGHLTYLGDAQIGSETNIGCGTITCNYAVDRKKYQTIIGNKVFVGSDTQFVAPIMVGDGAVIASGSTITKDVPSNALAVARGRQNNIENYVKDLGDKKESKGDS